MRQKIVAFILISILLCVISPMPTESETEVQIKQSTTEVIIEAPVEQTETVLLESKKPKEKWSGKYTGYVTTEKAKIYEKRNNKSKVLKTLCFNEKVKYKVCTEHPKWYQVKVGDTVGYISCKKLTEQNKYKSYELSVNKGFKSWMGHRCFSSRSNQGQLQLIAETDKNGLRVVNGRYTVAIGSHFNCDIGQYFDIVLKNGTIIPAVCGDQKADIHTDSTNVYSRNGCCTEFIVDSRSLNSKAKTSGDISSIYNEWDSSVVEIRVYALNALN